MRRTTVVVGLMGLCCTVAAPAGGASVLGTSEADYVQGTAGPDVIDTGAGNDRVWSYGGADEVRGGPGRDLLDLGRGDDFGHAGAGHDTVLGGPGDDVIGYGRGSNTLRGGRGADAIVSAGTDTVYGGPGPDDLSLEGRGLLWVSAGAGDDRIEIHQLDDDADTIRCGPGYDRVQYYTPGRDLSDHLVGCEEVNDES